MLSLHMYIRKFKNLVKVSLEDEVGWSPPVVTKLNHAIKSYACLYTFPSCFDVFSPAIQLCCVSPTLGWAIR